MFATVFTYTEFTNSKSVSPELSLRLMAEQPNRELARFQRLIQHL